MNWLAHAVLSPPNREIRLGNVMNDMIGREGREVLSSDFVLGMKLHLEIDRFTDSHPVVSESRRRFESPVKRYSGPILDVFFDHFLSASWSEWSAVSLDSYLSELYGDMLKLAPSLPGVSPHVAHRLVEENWMGSYTTVDGVRLTLERMSGRVRYKTGREVDLSLAVADLEENYDLFAADFRTFFPELVSLF